MSQKLREEPNITRKLLIPSETKIFSVSRKAVGLRNQSIAFLVDLSVSARKLVTLVTR